MSLHVFMAKWCGSGRRYPRVGAEGRTQITQDAAEASLKVDDSITGGTRLHYCNGLQKLRLSSLTYFFVALSFTVSCPYHVS